MTYKPKISVISACYNHGSFISDMIGSVINQTFREFELIIVNDGSTDNTKEYLDRIHDERIRVIHSENHGPSRARNLAISESRAPIILNLDSDDMIAPTLLEKAYPLFINDPNTGIVYSDVELFGAKKGKLNLDHYSIENMLRGNIIVSNAFFRREDWASVKGYSEELIFGLEDWDFWLSVIELGRTVVKIPEKLVFYRKAHKSRSGKRESDREKTKKSMFKVYHRHEKLYSGFPEISSQLIYSETRYLKEKPIIKVCKNILFRFLRKYYWT